MALVQVNKGDDYQQSNSKRCYSCMLKVSSSLEYISQYILLNFLTPSYLTTTEIVLPLSGTETTRAVTKKEP